MKRSVPCSIRIPTDLHRRMHRAVADGERYKDTAQFIITALYRHVTFEEEEMEAKRKAAIFKRDQIEIQF